MKKNSSTGLTDAPIIGASDAWRKFRRPVGLSLLEASWNQVKSLYITGWTDGPKQSTSALDVLCSREHVLVDLNSSSAPVEPTLKNQPSVHWMYYVPESLFELISEPLQHRLNRCPYGACTGAMTQAWILCQNSNGYFFDTERPVEPMPIFSIPSVLPVVTVFLQKTSNGYVTSSTLYKGTPWFISVAFDTLKT